VKYFAETFTESKLDRSFDSAKVSAKVWDEKYGLRLRPKLSRTNLTEVGQICMEEIA